MTLYAIDPRGAVSVSLAKATSASTKLGTSETLDAVEPGVYEARATGPVMVSFGSRAAEGGLVITPDAPARIVVTVGERLAAAAMSDGCTLSLHPIVRVPDGLVRTVGDDSSARSALRAKCG